MKKIIPIITFAMLLFSCKEDTKIKVKEATQAVSKDMKLALDSARVKAAKVIDTAKVKEKTKILIGKGAEKIEESAKKLKESIRK